MRFGVDKVVVADPQVALASFFLFAAVSRLPSIAVGVNAVEKVPVQSFILLEYAR